MKVLRRLPVLMGQSERRKEPRYATDEAVELVGPDGASSGAVLRDICRGGACLLTQQAIAVGEGLTVRGPFGEERAVVRHLARVPLGYLIGVQFARPIQIGGEKDATWPAAW